uniref:Serine-enriched protein n=1 Tax=Rhizophagus irregularis (strain DAOM 181602 / DAOM 197198 / MUCL 43194) TaxID=747089 RepID=U9SNW7_RHIID
MATIFHLGFSKDLSLILDDADDYNVIIQVGENQNIKEFRAHSVILRARSPYFKSALSKNWITKKDNMIIFNKSNITPTVFYMILKYIYTGELDLTKQSGENILGLLVASDELLLEELFRHVRDYLIEKQTKWVHENFVLVLNAVFRLDNCKKLQDYCLESICENPLPFFSSKIFSSINKEILFDLLERDDLQIKEVIIWDYLIKWGVEQTSGLGNESSNRAKWNNKDYKKLKKTLNQFIPLIRFTEISRADFFDKVCPYRTIIPNHIYEEIEECYCKDALPKTAILPPRTGYPFEIIKPILAKIIVNWIDKKDTMYIRTRNDQSYRFKLIYRGSRDGISSESFRKKCNGRVESLVLIKVKDTNKVFGGYSSIGFCSLGNDFTTDGSNHHRFYNSSDNFIFSFEDSEDTRHMKISRVVDKSQAILDSDYNGFNFGWGSLTMGNVSLHANNYSNNYENNLKTDTVYTIEEIESFNISYQ